jgi:hypothetical protein
MGIGSTTCSRVQLYHHLLGIWVGVDAGYVLELRVGDCIFLKASHIEDTPQFDKILHANSKAACTPSTSLVVFEGSVL